MIERPDSVSRVMAPMTAIASTMAQQPSSQSPTARSGPRPIAALSVPDAGRVVANMLALGLSEWPCHRGTADNLLKRGRRSEEHTSELQSLMRISYAVFCLKKNTPQ